MKKLINNRYANLYLNAAETLGFNYTILNEQAALAVIYNSETKPELSANVLGLNTQLGATLATNKKKTSLLLKELNIPVPDFRTFSNKKLAEKYLLNKIKDSQLFVVKPLCGSLSIGITVSPTTKREALEALREAYEGNSEILIEKYISGQHYRITVLDNEIIAVTQRLPAFVVGDGKRTVKELIKKKNTKRKAHQLPPILLRKKDLNYLKAQKIDTNSVLLEGQTMNLQLGCDLDIGGERSRVDRDSIPAINKELFIRAARALNLRFCGVDYISPDITIPYTEVTSAINELNSAPDSDVHYRDAYPHDNYAAERVLEKVFSTKTTNSIEHIFIPQAFNEQKDILPPFRGI